MFPSTSTLNVFRLFYNYFHIVPTPYQTIVLHYKTVSGNNEEQRHLELLILYVTKRREYI